MARETQGSPAGEKRLEQYGVWVKVKPREVIETPALEESFELSDLESAKGAAVDAAPPLEESSLTAEEEQLLDELETELGPDEASADVLVPEEEPLLADEGDLPDINTLAAEPEAQGVALGQASEEELPMLEEEPPAPVSTARAQKKPVPAADAGEVEVTLSEGAVEEDRFDDLEALESELASVASAPGTSTISSTQILARIEQELRSIRTDLTQLRGELSGLRKSAAEPGVETPAASDEAQGGFFDEDEDETIALTGDELDNILNTAEVTEEIAETPIPESDAGLQATEKEPAADVLQDDILSYETPLMEENAVPSEEATLVEDTLAEDTLILTEDSLLPSDESAEGEPGSAALEELPAELVLDDLSEETLPFRPSAALEELPELDLEGIPELETPAAPGGIQPAAPSAPGGVGAIPLEPEPVAKDGGVSQAFKDDGDETIDLETLDLGEEPTVIDAVPEQIDETEAASEQIYELEAIPEAEAVEEEKPSESLGALAGEIDLEALAAEAEDLEDVEVAVPPSDDLEIGELESVPDEEQAAKTPEMEIKIAFEGEPESQAGPTLPAPGAPMDEILEAEEVLDIEPAATTASAAGAEGVPDNLKDEIRTVLKYMDTLLEALPDEKIKEFASSDYFVMYKKLFEDLGLGE